MRIRNRHSRMLVPILAVTAAAAVVTGCGGDDDDESSEPSKITIDASGAKGDVTLTATSEVDSGAAEIELTNNTDIPDLDGQLAFVAQGEEHSDAEVAAELAKAEQGEPVADWFIAGGGPGSTAPGESTTVTQELESGTYYVLPTGADQEPFTKISVGGSDNGAELPEVDGEVDAAEYTFTSDGLPSGESKVLLDNKGGTWHHFLAAPLKPDATIEEAKAFLESQGGGGGPSPFAGSDDGPNASASTVMDSGVSQVVDLNLEPGNYAFFCFISDKQTGGPPHVVKGMVSEVEVK
jgi:hypothetical protein